MVRKLGLITVLLVAGCVVAAAALARGGGLPLGPSHHTAQPTYVGYYDGHKDTFLATDTSSKSQAKAMHINWSPEIGKEKNLPRQFFIMGHAAPGQVSVFGSEPGESDYNPLWDEVGVTWKAGATPVLLVRDDQIDGLAKKGMLTEKDLGAVLNAPILHVGK
jgi:hypothetical protein